jgi:xanthine dehydrogenase YagT iron-sulfur-binding subunit
MRRALTEEFVEPGALATDDRRPVFQRMLEQARESDRRFDVVLVHSFSRFYRNGAEMELTIRSLRKLGVEVVSVTQPTGDDPAQEMMRQIIGIFDDYHLRNRGNVPGAAPFASDRSVPMDFRINGRAVAIDVDLRTSLLDLLRDHLGLTGSKKGCNQGACGACTVLVDGERINACLALAVQYQGREIVTVEGLADGDGLHRLQAAFVAHDGFQCGYCTPGQLCSAIAMAAELARGVPSHVTEDLAAPDIALSRDELRERMSGNLCRCGAHNGIVAAIAETFGEDVRDPHVPQEKAA